MAEPEKEKDEQKQDDSSISGGNNLLSPEETHNRSTSMLRKAVLEKAGEKRKLYPILPQLDNGDEPQIYIISKFETVMGRSSRSDIFIASDAISRNHARIRYQNFDEPYEEPTCWIEDLGSKNGVYLNRKRVAEKTWLTHRDTVQLGDIAFCYFVRDEVEMKAHRYKSDSMLDRRSVLPTAARVRRSLDVMVSLRMPEETNSILEFNARTSDISIDGLSLRKEEIDKGRIVKLLRARRNAGAALVVPEMGTRLPIDCKIAWVRSGESEGHAYCTIGMQFLQLSPPAQSFFEGMLRIG